MNDLKQYLIAFGYVLAITLACAAVACLFPAPMWMN